MDTNLRAALQDCADFHSADPKAEAGLYGKFGIDEKSVGSRMRLLEAIQNQAIHALEAKP